MKKYNTPEIEALALETVDVIASSGNRAALAELQETYNVKADATEFGDVASLDTTWSW